MALPLVALANQVIGDQDFAAAAHGRNWPRSDLPTLPRVVRFSWVERTFVRRAQNDAVDPVQTLVGDPHDRFERLNS